MLIRLSGRALRPISMTSERPFIGRIVTNVVSARDQSREIVLCDHDAPEGFRAYLSFDASAALARHRDAYVLHRDFAYLADGDVVRVDPVRDHVHVLYRRFSRSNSLLVTERCDNYCLMCSQPPQDRDDSWIVDELLEAIPLMSPDTGEIGITGG